jgi:hypothetical protein
MNKNAEAAPAVSAVLHPTREGYLLAAIELFRPIFERHGANVPKVHVATGWPSSRGLSTKKRALGECWDKKASTDSVPQIFISPWLSDPSDIFIGSGDGMGVLPTLAHELVHAVLGYDAGHGPKFKKLALAIGLEGKMTSTHAGEKLVAEIRAMVPKLGEYPHAKLDAVESGKKKQGTRMVKCACDECGYTVRTTKKWLEVGPPHCPAHGAMSFELPEEDADVEEAEAA